MKSRINISCRLPGRPVYTRQGIILALISLLRDVTSGFIKLLRTRILQRALVPISKTDTIITDRQSDTTFSSSEHTECRYPGLFDKKSFGHVPPVGVYLFTVLNYNTEQKQKK